MFPLLIWELFSEIASVAGIPDGGTEPDSLVLLFSSRTFLPSPSPMLLSLRDNIQRHIVISQGSVPSPPAPTCSQRTPRDGWSRLFFVIQCSPQIFVDSNTMERQILDKRGWKHKYWTKWLSIVSAFWSRKQESEQDWEMSPNFSSTKILTFQKKSMPIC